jgi:hypothetical protein
MGPGTRHDGGEFVFAALSSSARSVAGRVPDFVNRQPTRRGRSHLDDVVRTGDTRVAERLFLVDLTVDDRVLPVDLTPVLLESLAG